MISNSSAVMALSNLSSKLKKICKIVIASRKQWQSPRKCEILIYGFTGAEIFKPYLLGYRIQTMAAEGEIVNVPCMLRAAFSGSFWRGEFLQAYTDAFIRLTSPRVVLTYVDNNKNFYIIRKQFPKLKTMFLQSGSRSEIGDIFDSLKPSDRYHVDYMLVHGLAIGSYYQKFVSGAAIVVGSVKSNKIERSFSITSHSVLFISQYNARPDGNMPFFVRSSGEKISWEDFFAAEILILPFLANWCAKNGMVLQICGRAFDERTAEYNYYVSLLSNYEWQYIERTDDYSSYALVDVAEIVVSIDSTLGYESLGRGKKTACFSCRGDSLRSESAKFGWPAKLADNGPFWTNCSETEEFQRVMDYLKLVGDEEWTKTCRQFTKDLMEFDAGNTRFRELLSQLMPK